MILKGLQKLTLLDYPGKVAATIFTGGCNMRCPFCHNAPLVLTPNEVEGMTADEVLSFLSRRVGILDGICLTGGEPLLQPDVVDFLKAVKEIGYSVKLDTNGTNPGKLRLLVEKGLVDYVAMDIKNTPARYAETVGVEGFDMTPIFDAVAFLKSGVVPCEFRTTVVREFHTERELSEIADWLSGATAYYLQAYLDSGHLICSDLHGYTEEEMRALHAKLALKMPTVKLRGM